MAGSSPCPPGGTHCAAAAEVIYQVLEGGRPSTWVFCLENAAFSLEIEKGQAIFHLKNTVSKLDEATQRTESFLSSWDAELALQTGDRRREFILSSREAPGLGGQAFAHGTATVTRPPALVTPFLLSNPWLAPAFPGDELVTALIEGYERYRRGRDRLSAMAYLCLTAAENARGGRAAVSRDCRIQPKVLQTLGRLTSTAGSYGTARKIQRDVAVREYAPEERYWMERATCELIRRLGSARAGTDIETDLAMSSLPPL